MKKYSFEPGQINLELTLTCGQTFCWNRFNGDLYGEGEKQFYTFRKGKPLIVREHDDGKVEAETNLSRDEVEESLDLETDLETVFNSFPRSEALDKAKKDLWGLRIINDEFFPCLISYLCSPQMRIPRIKQMHDDIAEKFGEETTLNNQTVHRFPTPEELGEATEQQLRDLGTGYRAKYIVETTKMINEGHIDYENLSNLSYSEAKKEIKKLHGVGDKVADCVLLFSKNFHEAYPIDTWAQKCIKTHYPELHHDKYEKTSENLRKHFGEKAGYAQEYLFHAARKDLIQVED